MQSMANTPADALSNPVRLAIVRRLQGAEAATLDELADAAGVHRNTARSHAAALETAGLIERTRAGRPAGAGRPRTRYQLVSMPRTNHPPPLAGLLGGALAKSSLSQREARRVGRVRAAAANRFVPKRRRLRELQNQLSALGFRAEISDGDVELDGCPCPLIAPDNPAVVCALVSGTIEGALERMGSAARVICVEHNPAARHCTLRIAEAT
jgi:predicted ArsR family transcriptional regulator